MASPSPSSSAEASSVEVVVEQHEDRLAVHVRGEIDIASHDLLAQQLAALSLTGTPTGGPTAVTTVELCLGGLHFCDSHGVRQLLAFADGARRTGLTVDLHDVRPQLARLIALIAAPTAA